MMNDELHVIHRLSFIIHHSFFVINLKSNSYDLSKGFKIHQRTRVVAD